jgi:hypothetical protein
MESIMRRFIFPLVLFSSPAFAETPQDFLARFQKESGSIASAERGARFYKATHGNDWSCASCHTENPAATGRHAKTDKIIKPLAPAANPERFSDTAKVDKWFRRNCNDVLGRECAAGEKADLLAFLLTRK